MLATVPWQARRATAIHFRYGLRRGRGRSSSVDNLPGRSLLGTWAAACDMSRSLRDDSSTLARLGDRYFNASFGDGVQWNKLTGQLGNVSTKRK
mmetsp:Transcript_2569/g.5878  ORF Transcript_2569/g.5878 Transcript_2569/m.5878 type:complete len:94 (-) Transcript_2569:411-692(-)